MSTSLSPELTSLSLTHVRYDSSSKLAVFSAYFSLLPQALVIVYVSLIWSTREFEIIWMFAGQMSSEGLNFVLKRLLKGDRPSNLLGKGYGMPSSHSQFTAYWAVYLVYFLVFRFRPVKASFETSLPARVGLSVSALLVAVVMPYSRVMLNYHTPFQTIVGFSVGAIYASIWYSMNGYLRKYGWVEYVCGLEVVKAFKIRDLCCSQDLWLVGWNEYQSSRASRSIAKAR